MKPLVEVYKMEASSMVCFSGGKGGSATEPAKAPIHGDWDEDIDLDNILL